MSTEVRELVIVGSGPAGYTAAIYAARAQLNPVMYEGSVTAGGALMNTTEVENFPGFIDGIMGPDLMDNMRKQSKRFGTELITDDVVEEPLIESGRTTSIARPRSASRRIKPFSSKISSWYLTDAGEFSPAASPISRMEGA